MDATEQLVTEKPTLAAKAEKPAMQRSMLVDVVRGVAISLVALGHTDQGTIRRDWWGQSQVGWQIERFIYAFHMPAFFFVSGVFLASSVAKRGPVKFTNNKIAQMMWPYLLWSVLIYALSFPFARFMKEDPASLPAFLMNLVAGRTLWFLPAVFFCVLLGMLLRNVNKPLVFVLAVAVSLMPLHTPLDFIETSLVHFPFLVAGMWVSREYERIERISLPVAAVSSLVLAVSIFLLVNGPLKENRWSAVPIGLAGTAMLFLLARCLRRDALARTLAWIGEASFGVYLLSAYAQGFGRELLLRGLHTTEPYLQLVVPTLLAILIPAWIYQHRVKLKVDWMFLWPL